MSDKPKQGPIQGEEFEEEPELRPGEFPHRHPTRGDIWKRTKDNWRPLLVSAIVIGGLAVTTLFLVKNALDSSNRVAQNAQKYTIPNVNPNTRLNSIPLPPSYVDPNQQQPPPYPQQQQTQQQKALTPAEEQAQKYREIAWKAHFAAPDSGRKGSQTEKRIPPMPGQETTLVPSSAFPEKPQQKYESELPKGQENAAQDGASGGLYRIFGGITLITARMMNAIAGEMAGPVISQVSQDVWSWNREVVLIPKGSYLTGTYKRVMDQDQERVEVTLNSMVMPDGWRTDFPSVSALDQTGQSGLRDQVNHHYAQIFLTSIAISGIGASASFGSSSGYTFSPVSALRIGFAEGSSQAANQVLQRYAYRRPTLTIRPGIEINLFAPCDLALPDWRKHEVNPHL